MRKISLTRGEFALVDSEDYHWLSQFKWLALKCGCGLSKRFYAARMVYSGKNRWWVMMHREILGAELKAGQDTDHIDGNGLNNRRSNLRPCSNQQNAFNQRLRNGTSSRFKGVARRKASAKWRNPPPWQAQIGFNRRLRHLGYFGSEIKAAKAYDEAAARYFGEFARLNFPQRRDL